MAAHGGSTTKILTLTGEKPKRGRKPKNHPRCDNKQLLSLLSAVTSAAHSFLSQNELHLLPSQSLSLESLLSSLPFSPSPSPSPSQSFFHRFLSSAPDETDPRWITFFRMSKPTFAQLLGILSPSLLSSLPQSIPPDSALAAAVFRLAHGASYESVAQRFGLDSSEAACIAFYSVCKAVTDKLSNLVEFRKNIEAIEERFRWISLPNCCGVLGFGKFGVDSELLGGNGSLLVQGLVDAQGRFSDISAGWPCTMKLSSIFTQSKFFFGIEESIELLNGSYCEISEGISIPRYIIGDSCLPLLPWLLTPYIRPDEEDSFGSAEREFNTKHKIAMELVHTAFGRVKAQWQLLAKRWKEESMEFFPFVIVMGCLLHNFLINFKEPMPEGVGCLSKEEGEPAFNGEADGSGLRLRDMLATHLRMLRMRSHMNAV